MAFRNMGLPYRRYCVYNIYFGRHDDEIRCRKWVAIVDGSTWSNPPTEHVFVGINYEVRE
jgi:hypothetical protein